MELNMYFKKATCHGLQRYTGLIAQGMLLHGRMDYNNNNCV